MNVESVLLRLPDRLSGNHCMSIRELCNNDDLATTISVDTILGFKTHKMNLHYRSPQFSDRYQLKNILRAYIKGQDLSSTLVQLLKVSCVQSFLSKRSSKEQASFRDHLLRFLQMFDSGSGFTIRPCVRYRAENRLGAMLVVTKPWRKGEVIDTLVGVIGDLSSSEEKELLRKDVNDFSVMYSTRCFVLLYIKYECSSRRFSKFCLSL
ncbi:hypothetical protein AB6A40_009093 [Gnathostoma spinigerum]|uniref:Uncharacterized protein n=1 Tax=Gnathostoma spinigerum TaxID=75299 RepID=A0ABD6EYQ8_9BILA